MKNLSSSPDNVLTYQNISKKNALPYSVAIAKNAGMLNVGARRHFTASHRQKSRAAKEISLAQKVNYLYIKHKGALYLTRKFSR